MNYSMENLAINSTKYTPEIKTDAESGVIKFSGSSYPENANEFYRPVYQWVDDYFANEHQKLEVSFYIYYFNTSTSKCFMNLLEKLEQKADEGKDIFVNWYYSKDDEDSLDSGEKLFMEMNLKHQFVPVDNL